ncbi:MAG: putative aggregation factor core protein MAFp3, isoform [Bacteroidetes bacterium]|nr:putative aggregation factor core protein MAFp3, isoform [Bacteroidota bacterium]
MKKLNLLLFITLTALFLVSCEKKEDRITVLIDFEDVQLTDSIYNGSDLSGTKTVETTEWGNITNYYKNIKAGVTQLVNIYTSEYFSWKGFAVSAKRDVKTNSYENQYSTIAGTGAAASKQFGVIFESGKIIFPELLNTNVKSLMLTNTTWAYKAITEGSGLARKFAAGDYFKVIIEGYTGNQVSAKQEFYLADFRDGKSLVVKDWTKVNLVEFNSIDYLVFTFDSSDKNNFGILTPTYVCVDNFELELSELCDCDN